MQFTESSPDLEDQNLRLRNRPDHLATGAGPWRRFKAKRRPALRTFFPNIADAEAANVSLRDSVNIRHRPEASLFTPQPRLPSITGASVWFTDVAFWPTLADETK